jgi:hypothetical protein
MIYFIACPAADAVKIGMVTQKHYESRPEQSAFQRLTAMQSGCPFELELLALCDGGQATEAQLHLRFASHRIRGEWFKLNDDLRAHIAQFPKPIRTPRGWHSQARNRIAA